MDHLDAIRRALAISVAIDEGQLLAAPPADPGDHARHVAALSLLEVQRGLLEAVSVTYQQG